MELILLRHGKAEDHSSDDFNRALVEKGIHQAKSAANFLKGIHRLPDVMLTSPRIRAKQTAEHFCKEAGIGEPIIQKWIDCGMSPAVAIKELVAYTEFHRVMLVGHEPDFSGLAEHLLGCGEGGVQVKKGSLVGLHISPPGERGWLIYSMPPKFIQ